MVRMAVNRRASPVYCFSPRKISLLMSADPTSGATTGRVANGLCASKEFGIRYQTAAPLLFRDSPSGGGYATALASYTFAYLGPVGVGGGDATSYSQADDHALRDGLGSTISATDLGRVVNSPLTLASSPS